MLNVYADSPRAELGIPFLVAQEVFWSDTSATPYYFLATPTRHSKGAPLCRYIGVTRKVPFKLRPKDRKKVSDGY